jgi:ankyrin repeat protein
MSKFEAPNDHPIFPALLNGDSDAVDRYLKEGVDPYLNGVISGGIRGGHLPVMEVLLTNGVGVNKPMSDSGLLPIMRAIEKRQLPVIQFLLEKGADINGGLGEGATALIIAVSYFPEAIPFLLERGAVVEARALNGATAFFQASAKNLVETMELFHKAGADIEVALIDGTTPLLATVRAGAEEAMHWLIGHGANIHVKDKRGRSAVWWALECNRLQTAEFLRGMGVE